MEKPGLNKVWTNDSYIVFDMAVFKTVKEIFVIEKVDDGIF